MNNVNPNTIISAAQTLKNVESYHAFGSIVGYKANNPGNSREAADAAYAKLRAAEQNAITTRAAAAAAADALISARLEFHGVMLGVKTETTALYGPSSDEVAALGLKKKSEKTKKSKPKQTGT